MSGIHDNGHAALLLKIWQYLQKCITTLIFFVGFDYIILSFMTGKGNSEQGLFCTSFVFFYKQYGAVLCHRQWMNHPCTWHTVSVPVSRHDIAALPCFRKQKGSRPADPSAGRLPQLLLFMRRNGGIRFLLFGKSGGRLHDQAVEDDVGGGHQEDDGGHADQGAPGQEGADGSDHIHARVG